LLHAVIHNKKTRVGGDAWNLEDNITSTFFGPLRFMSFDESWYVLKQIFNISLDHEPDQIALDFWPRFKLREPDMMIYLSKNDSRIKTILLEVKWEASQSGSEEEHQLKQQYNAYKKSYKKNHGESEWLQEKETLTIIYLVLRKDKAIKELTTNNRPDHLIEIKTWNQIALSLQRMDSIDTCGLKMWRKDSLAYLSKLLGNVFHGFNDDIFKFQPHINKDILFFGIANNE